MNPPDNGKKRWSKMFFYILSQIDSIAKLLFLRIIYRRIFQYIEMLGIAEVSCSSWVLEVYP